MGEDRLAIVEAAARGFSAGLLDGDRPGKKRVVASAKSAQRKLSEPVSEAAWQAGVSAALEFEADSVDHEELQRLADELTGHVPEGYVDPAEEARDTPHTWT